MFAVVAGGHGRRTGAVVGSPQWLAPVILAVVGSLGLVLGVLVYVTDRDSTHAMLLPALATLATGPVFGVVGPWLPSFAHPFAFSLLTAAAMRRSISPAYRRLRRMVGSEHRLRVRCSIPCSAGASPSRCKVCSAKPGCRVHWRTTPFSEASTSTTWSPPRRVHWRLQAYWRSSIDWRFDMNQVDTAPSSRMAASACAGLVTTLGLVAIVGSGGGAEDANCSFWSDTCVPEVGPIPPIPSATIGPQRVAVQVGGTLVFRVQSNVAQPVYSWCRLPAGASACAKFWGVSDQYTLAGANLTDDGDHLPGDGHRQQWQRHGIQPRSGVFDARGSLRGRRVP